MALSCDEIIGKIDEHLKKSGKRYYSQFYIGISQNASKRLFEEHHVDREHSWWIYITANSTEDAKKVMRYYLNLGMRGGLNKEDMDSKMIYCYVVTPTTTE